MVVTIALLIKNGEDYLSSLLTSLRGQESEVNVHILSIDSGSIDDSPSLVRQLTTMWQTGGSKRLVNQTPDDPEIYERDKFLYIYFTNTSSAIRHEVWE